MFISTNTNYLISTILGRSIVLKFLLQVYLQIHTESQAVGSSQGVTIQIHRPLSFPLPRTLVQSC